MLRPVAPNWLGTEVVVVGGVGTRFDLSHVSRTERPGVAWVIHSRGYRVGVLRVMEGGSARAGRTESAVCE